MDQRSKIEKLLDEKSAMYGGDIFETIAEFWTTYLEYDISSSDVCIMMILLKSARFSASCVSRSAEGAIDSIDDILGYAHLLVRDFKKDVDDSKGNINM